VINSVVQQAAVHRRQLADHLADAGYLRDPAWRAAFSIVPRELFAPRFVIDIRGERTAYDTQDADPERRATALEACYRNEPLITRTDAAGVPISSSTEPSLMALMLEALAVRDGHRVLEIGVGTGYNAALLCHRLADTQVTTIDVESSFVADARTALHAAGYRPAVACLDGREGYPANAPYDRIMVTCGVDRIPDAWHAQLAPDGAILVNLSRGLVLLRRGADGVLSGKFFTQAGFMPLRKGNEPSRMTGREIVAATDGDPETSTTADVPSELDFRTASCFASLVAAGSELIFVLDDAGQPASYRWVHRESGSWVRVQLDGDRPAVIDESGPRRLWAELVPILTTWHTAGRPTLDRFGVTITPGGEHLLWLDRLGQVIQQLR
jgi:protein-L-isoaspartate O-methyltransferase